MYRETVVHASATRTATGGAIAAAVDTLNGGPERSDNGDTRFNLNVTAASGTTPTLDVTLWAVINGIDYQVGAFTQKTGVIKDSIVVSACPRNVYAKYTIGGTTPSFTFEVTCSRH